MKMRTYENICIVIFFALVAVSIIGLVVSLSRKPVYRTIPPIVKRVTVTSTNAIGDLSMEDTVKLPSEYWQFWKSVGSSFPSNSVIKAIALSPDGRIGVSGSSFGADETGAFLKGVGMFVDELKKTRPNRKIVITVTEIPVADAYDFVIEISP